MDCESTMTHTLRDIIPEDDTWTNTSNPLAIDTP